jgi:small-conductance mechanosensitive channel
MDIQQSINLAIFETFEKEGIAFAYPTQTLYIDGKSREDRPPGAFGATTPGHVL